jgi:orotate phosphoribosyltransferase
MTTGGQIVASATALRIEGARVDVVVAVIDREAGAGEHLAAEGLELRTLFTVTELQAAAASHGDSRNAGQ